MREAKQQREGLVYQQPPSPVGQQDSSQISPLGDGCHVAGLLPVPAGSELELVPDAAYVCQWGSTK